ncbi:S1C family serine protease [Microbacterium karelineae]|uniref:S1C family serine protease n=1 Tax=Microbacterium karelineae TaxID=2654283 RepID=UPI0012E9F5C9|nr:trypsin-like peptidase domain-containing protein [Microbacterium karelineae]
MSNDSGTPIPPLPERSAADAAAQSGHANSAPTSQYAAPAYSTAPVQGPQPAPTATAPAYEWAPQSPVKKKQKSGTGSKVTALFLAAALIGGGAGFGGAWLGNSVFGGSGGDQSTVATGSGSQNITINNPDDVNETAAVAASALPSVVTIEAASSSAGGSGSGVVLSEDGYVLTNTHVVTLGGAASDAQLRVTASDGTLYDATIVGTDPTYDLAVIKLEGASGLTPMEFADSSELNVGDTTVAIGAPMGLSNTVTTGVISNLNRSIEIASSAAPEGDEAEDPDAEGGQESPWFFDLPGQEQQQQQSTESIKIAVLQTDAAINPGNSGGALVDGEGRLIGINVAIATAATSSEEGGSIGLGFAIPSNIAERIANEIIDTGAASHGLLGASVAPSSSIEGTTTTGAYVAEVVGGGAAEDAGLKEGDVITRFNGVRVNDAVDLTAQVRAAAAESRATVTYVRDGEENEAELTLGTLE